MSISTESLLVALSGIVIVFIMLAALSLLIVGLSRIVGSLAGNKPAAAAPAPAPRPAPAAAPAAPAPVQLSGVSDLTAACIMAIVSDELGTTPDQLVFRSIKAL